MSGRRLLHDIDSPADLRRLPREQVEQVADELRAEILERVSQTGGHLASSLGAVELITAIPRSALRSASQQFEIVALVILRSFFKDFYKLNAAVTIMHIKRGAVGNCRNQRTQNAAVIFGENGFC